MPFHMCGSRNIYLTDWGFMKAACSAVPYKLYIRFTLIAGSSKNLQTTSDIYMQEICFKIPFLLSLHITLFQLHFKNP